jgi:hypothetical protein
LTANFWRMNCQMFSWLFSSGERGGNGSSEMLCGYLCVGVANMEMPYISMLSGG